MAILNRRGNAGGIICDGISVGNLLRNIDGGHWRRSVLDGDRRTIMNGQSLKVLPWLN